MLYLNHKKIYNLILGTAILLIFVLCSCNQPEKQKTENLPITSIDSFIGKLIFYKADDNRTGRIYIERISMHKNQDHQVVISSLKAIILETQTKFEFNLSEQLEENGWMKISNFSNTKMRFRDTTLSIESLSFKTGMTGINPNQILEINKFTSGQFSYNSTPTAYCWFGPILHCSSFSDCLIDSTETCIGFPPLCICLPGGGNCPFTIVVDCLKKECSHPCQMFKFPEENVCFCEL